MSDQVSHPYKMRDNITMQQEIYSLIYTVWSPNIMVTQVGMNFLPEKILVGSYWELVHKLECVNETFLSPSVWMIPVNNSAEITKTKIGGWVKHMLCCSFNFTHLSQFTHSNNVVPNCLSNKNILFPPV